MDSLGGPGRLPAPGSHRAVRACINAYGSSDHGFASRSGTLSGLSLLPGEDGRSKLDQTRLLRVESQSVLAESFPRGYYFLTDQLNRAAISIATNLAEGNGRFTKADRRNTDRMASVAARTGGVLAAWRS